MNKRILVTAIALLLGLVAMNDVGAQTQKVGQVDIQYVLTSLPEYKQVESQLKDLEAQLMKQSQAKEKEFQDKYQDYVQNGQNMADVVKADRERELTQLQQSYADFQQTAQTSLASKSTELLNPLYKKIGDAIDQVAEENGYSHVFNVGVAQFDILIYGNDDFDISNLVLKKLGINPTAN